MYQILKIVAGVIVMYTIYKADQSGRTKHLATAVICFSVYATIYFIDLIKEC